MKKSKLALIVLAATLASTPCSLPRKEASQKKQGLEINNRHAIYHPEHRANPSILVDNANIRNWSDFPDFYCNAIEPQYVHITNSN